VESLVSLSWCIRQGTHGEGDGDADYLPPQHELLCCNDCRRLWSVATWIRSTSWWTTSSTTSRRWWRRWRSRSASVSCTHVLLCCPIQRFISLINLMLTNCHCPAINMSFCCCLNPKMGWAKNQTSSKSLELYMMTYKGDPCIKLFSYLLGLRLLCCIITFKYSLNEFVETLLPYR